MTNKLIVFSAPSGAGKTTLVKYILKTFSEIEFSISATSRKARGEEKDGKDYYFVTEETIPHLITIDVEGHENEVLHGGKNCLINIKLLIIMESFPPKQEQAIDFLKKMGYSVWDAERNESVGTHTNNLFAWHPNGPLAESQIQEIIES